VGRKVIGLIRQVQALQLVRETSGAEATLSSWQLGRTILKVAPELVGKVWRIWTTDQAFQDP
jgi:peroxiredoxin (alkyl hydroperoxide reductase subunit C)